MFFIVKVFFSALIIAIVTVIAKKFPSYGGIIAALPLVSLLSLIWLSIQGENSNSLSKFALGVLWGFPATVVLLLIVAVLLKNDCSLWISLALGITGWAVLITLQEKILKQFIRIFS